MFRRIQNESLRKECIRVRIRGTFLAEKGAPKLNFYREGGQLPPSAPLNPPLAPAKICLLKSVADVRSIAVISGPLLLGMSAFVSTDRTKVKIKKSGLPNMHSPSQYFLTSKLGVGGIELRFNSKKQHITKDEMNLRK